LKLTLSHKEEACIIFH